MSVAGSEISAKKGTAILAILRPISCYHEERRAVPLFRTKETRIIALKYCNLYLPSMLFSIYDVTQLYAIEDLSQRKKIKNIAFLDSIR